MMATRQYCFEFAARRDDVNYYLLSYWREAAEREGYASIPAAIIGLYRETGSLAETAQRLGFSKTQVREKLCAYREPLRGPGGPNNPWGRWGRGGKANSDEQWRLL